MCAATLPESRGSTGEMNVTQLRPQWQRFRIWPSFGMHELGLYISFGDQRPDREANPTRFEPVALREARYGAAT